MQIESIVSGSNPLANQMVLFVVGIKFSVSTMKISNLHQNNITYSKKLKMEAIHMKEYQYIIM